MVQAALQEAIQSGQQIDLTEQPDEAELAMATARIEREERAGEAGGTRGAAGDGAPAAVPRSDALVKPLKHLSMMCFRDIDCNRPLCRCPVAALVASHHDFACIQIAWHA